VQNTKTHGKQKRKRSIKSAAGHRVRPGKVVAANSEKKKGAKNQREERVNQEKRRRTGNGRPKKTVGSKGRYRGGGNGAQLVQK